ncbi:MAG TPA: methylmalonyl-CoA epimerase [Chitinophagales bacterium]|jgi:methylmalonyl-CoA/ethylmalonyl-CoA epimerase|nr:methylmalonyl-CoA epimerase [Chitinophagales bacterium]MBP6153696.1 methylmalonyl-CoA epimerase [Chitinophagales bacterium]HQV77882.1 methylmalonyl-CoA epimerase [Chitinophagales bacterium]HQW78603.1 methylmalonyl-CoA epimerase [Chitinophagales bacterium]HRB66481.1 methylmalonyl-CoA epimerase [Chitinophagales bacterium]
MKKIDHIGIAVKDLDASVKLFSKLFNKKPFHQEEVLSEKLDVSFFDLGDTKVELMQAHTTESKVYKYLEKKGEGIHHVCFEVQDIYAEMQRLKAEGFQPLTEEPYLGALNKLVCFFHPKTTNGILIELCQKQQE